MDYKKMRKDREKWLTEWVEHDLPQFKEMGDFKAADIVIQHQDAFAADYQPSELLLLGAAIKYLGLKGKTVHIIGKNGETLE